MDLRWGAFHSSNRKGHTHLAGLLFGCHQIPWMQVNLSKGLQIWPPFFLASVAQSPAQKRFDIPSTYTFFYYLFFWKNSEYFVALINKTNRSYQFITLFSLSACVFSILKESFQSSMGTIISTTYLMISFIFVIFWFSSLVFLIYFMSKSYFRLC